MIKNTFRVVIDETGKLTDDFKHPSEVAWKNIQEGASIYHLGFVSSACMGWLRANPEQCVQDLERKLREENIPVHLLASPKYSKTHEDKELILRPYQKGSEEPKYALVYSCRPEKDALNEILEHWESYDENFKHLSQAGALSIKDGDISGHFLSETSDKITSKGLEAVKEGSHLNAISYNCVVLECKPLDQKDLMEDLNRDIVRAKEFFQKEPEPSVIGTAPDGSPVTAFILDKKLVSTLGVITKKEKDDSITKKIVNLQDKSTWKWDEEQTAVNNL